LQDAVLAQRNAQQRSGFGSRPRLRLCAAITDCR
jgi:hypothetical protein